MTSARGGELCSSVPDADAVHTAKGLPTRPAGGQPMPVSAADAAAAAAAAARERLLIASVVHKCAAAASDRMSFQRSSGPLRTPLGCFQRREICVGQATGKELIMTASYNSAARHGDFG